MRTYYVLIGNFGSGKSEISINLAINAAKKENSVLVDLDIVNPYFRSAERKKEIEAAGVKLLYPVFALSTVDVPSLPPDIYSVFVPGEGTVVFDVGGDPAGATALGQYNFNFQSIDPERLHVLYVVNVKRPLSDSPEKVLDMIEKIEYRSRLKIKGFINNANLAGESSAEDLLEGYALLREVSYKLDVPVLYTAGTQEALTPFMRRAEAEGFDKRCVGEPMEIEIYMHRDWDRFTRLGV